MTLRLIEGIEIESNAYGAIQRARTNKANAVLLHELYFDGMTPKTSKLSEHIRTAFRKRFGAIKKWTYDFQASAKAATGWAMLISHPPNGKLYNEVSDNHTSGVLWMATLLVVIDVTNIHFTSITRIIRRFILKDLCNILTGEKLIADIRTSANNRVVSNIIIKGVNIQP